MSQSNLFHRKVFTSHAFLGGADNPTRESSATPTATALPSNESNTAQSSPPPSFRNIHPCGLHEVQLPPPPICAVKSNMHNGIILADELGRLSYYHTDEKRLSLFLISKELQDKWNQTNQSETSTNAITSISPTNLTCTDASITSSTTLDQFSSEEQRYRCDMVKNGFVVFHSREPIIDLHWYNDRYQHESQFRHWSSIDLIHANFVTRLEYRSIGPFLVEVPQIASIRTLFTMPEKIISSIPSPGFDQNCWGVVGPYLVTRENSPDIWLVQPYAPTIEPRPIVRGSDLSTILEHSGFKSAESSTTRLSSPPVLALPERREWEFIFVLSHGHVFQIDLDLDELKFTDLTIIIGPTPHIATSSPFSSTSPSTVIPRSVPFFRMNSSEYCLQEIQTRFYVLDRIQGCVSQFSSSGQLEQCIEPEAPSGLTVHLPLKTFAGCSLPPHRYERRDGVRPLSSMLLIDGDGHTVYHWTCSHQQKCLYGLDTNRRSIEPIKPVKPLQPAMMAPQMDSPLVLAQTIKKARSQKR